MSECSKKQHNPVKKFRWLKVAPFGGPVVPLVYENVYISSLLIGKASLFIYLNFYPYLIKSEKLKTYNPRALAFFRVS